MAWHAAGVFVFYVNLTLAAWIKFVPLALASILMTVVFGLGLAFFVVRSLFCIVTTCAVPMGQERPCG